VDDSGQPDLPNSEIIPPELTTALQKAGVNTADPNVYRAVRISLIMASGYLPLPPASLLAEYQKEVPELVPVLVEMINDQRVHRKALEQSEARRRDRAQWFAFTTALLGVACAASVGIYGNPWVAGLLAIVSVGGPAVALVVARNWALRSDKTKTPPE